MNRLLLFFCLPLFLFTTCTDPAGSDGDDPLLLSFDRRGMLTEWVDEVIVPAHQGFSRQLAELSTAAEVFRTTPDQETLSSLRASFKAAYLAYQALDPVIIGQGEINRMRERTNTYPTDEALILEHIGNPTVNLELPSNTASQGLPAMEYLLYAAEDNLLADAAYRDYFAKLVSQVSLLNEEALGYWLAGNREVYIQNDGNSATASIDRTVNDFIFYYERFLRAGKVGIPAGIFSDDPLPNRAEARYAGYSRELLLAAVGATDNFFTNKGLKQYLDALEVRRDGELLSSTISQQFQVVKEVADDQLANFSEQVTTDNASMLRLYDEMQKLVVLLKVDMLQALSINVDYVDADGD